MLGQHALVDRDPLVRQRVDFADLGRECRVEQMSVGQPLAFNKHAQRIRVPEEVEPG